MNILPPPRSMRSVVQLSEYPLALMCRVQTYTGSVEFFRQGFYIERGCCVFVAGTNIQTNEEVGIKLVRTLAIFTNPRPVAYPCN